MTSFSNQSKTATSSTNRAKNSTSFSNQQNIGYVTWASIPSTWAAETRTWAETDGTAFTNQTKN